MADQTILQETLDNNIVDGDWLIYWKTSTGVQRRVERSSLLGATLTGAGTIATGGFTLTVPATGTAALMTATQTLTNKTLTTPTIGDLTNAQHTHNNAVNGGILPNVLYFRSTAP